MRLLITKKGNEFYYSDLIANNFETVHEKYKVSDLDLLKNLDEVILSMSEPMVSQDSSAFYSTSQKCIGFNKGGYEWSRS